MLRDTRYVTIIQADYPANATGAKTTTLPPPASSAFVWVPGQHSMWIIPLKQAGCPLDTTCAIKRRRIEDWPTVGADTSEQLVV